MAQEAELCPRGRPQVLDVSRHGAEDLGTLVRQVDVFARVSPAQKHRIVRALQQAGEVVAMATRARLEHGMGHLGRRSRSALRYAGGHRSIKGEMARGPG